ncbi:MAG: hypothetical protein Tsb006_1390 [Rickettsiaceae bacterium]
MPHRYSAIFIGLSQFIGTLGPMVAAGPMNSISESMGIGWRFIFLCLGGIGIILTTLILFLVENNPQKAGKYLILYKPKKIVISLLSLFSRTQPWYLALFSASLYFTIEYLSENEGRTFLVLKGISMSSASYMITISWIGYALGCLLSGFLSDMLERRKIIMQSCAVIGLVAIIMILYLRDKLHIQIAFLLLGVSASGQSVGLAAMAEQFKKPFVALGFGLNNTMITAVSVVNTPLIGLLLDYTRNGNETTLNEYLLVFNVLLITVIVALIMAFFFIKETYCKSSVDFTVLGTKKAFQ